MWWRSKIEWVVRSKRWRGMRLVLLAVMLVGLVAWPLLRATSLYITDQSNISSSIDLVDNGTVSTFATGLDFYTDSVFGYTGGLALDASGNFYVSEIIGGNTFSGNGTIYRVTPDGNHTVFAAGLNTPRGLAFDTAGTLYVTDIQNDQSTGVVYKYTTAGVRSTLATFRQAFYLCGGIAVDSSKNVYVTSKDADGGFSVVYKITPDGVVSTFLPGATFDSNVLDGLTFDNEGNLYAGDFAVGNVIKITPDGTASIYAVGFDSPTGIAFDKNGVLYVADTGTDAIYKLPPGGGTFDSGNIFAVGFNFPNSIVFPAGEGQSPPPAPPTITNQPVDVAINPGKNASFTVTVAANTSPVPTYQWQVSTDNGATWTNITNNSTFAGATTNKLTLTGATVDLSGQEFRCQITSGGVATTKAVILTVAATLTAPKITAQPVLSTVLVSDPANFTVNATGTPAPRYQWMKNNVAIAGATNATLSFANTAKTDAATYKVVVSNPLGSVTSQSVKLDVKFAASIVTQPANSTVSLEAGKSVTFTIKADGNPAPIYGWFFSEDGGATYSQFHNTTLTPKTDGNQLRMTLTTLQMDGLMIIGVATNNIGGLAQANPITLNVSTKPKFVQQPKSVTTTQGSTVLFTTLATSTPEPTYKWLHNNVVIANETNATLTLPNVSVSPASSYVCVATNRLGSANSTVAKLTVTAGTSGNATAPAISKQPANITVFEGQTMKFAVAATGTAPLVFQWQSSTDGGSTWANVTNGNGTTGATLASLSMTKADTSMNSWKFRCVVNNASVTPINSNAAVLTVGIKPKFSPPMADLNVVAGSNATFTSTVSAFPTPSYQWFKGTSPLDGETNSTLTLTDIQSGNTGTYSVKATNIYGTATDSGLLKIVLAPNLAIQPGNMTIAAGQTVHFGVAATGTAPLFFLWQFSSNGGLSWSSVTNGNGVSGATTPTLAITRVQGSLDGYQFRCIVNNSSHLPAASNGATLTVHSPPSYTTKPQNATVSAGANPSFTVAAAGSLPITIQWFKGSQTMSTTGNTLSLTNVQAADAGTYTAVATNAYGTASASATLTVTP